jgi:hypothetical protein
MKLVPGGPGPSEVDDRTLQEMLNALERRHSPAFPVYDLFHELASHGSRIAGVPCNDRATDLRV